MLPAASRLTAHHLSRAAQSDVQDQAAQAIPAPLRTLWPPPQKQPEWTKGFEDLGERFPSQVLVCLPPVRKRPSADWSPGGPITLWRIPGAPPATAAAPEPGQPTLRSRSVPPHQADPLKATARRLLEPLYSNLKQVT